jgi:AraC-like DNA-binding protein
MELKTYTEDNLASHPGVYIETSIPHPTGAGARNPQILLNERAHRLDNRPLSEFAEQHTYNTYDGQNKATQPDWYKLEFDQPVTFNCIELTMGLPYRDGGWWLSLDVEIYQQERWQKVETLSITPPYNFENNRGERRPYETHMLNFSEVTTQTVRLIGQPGGLAQFTSLARLAVYYRDLSRWSPAHLTDAPIPDVLHLISPQAIWDLSENLSKLCGLTINFPLTEYYLDQPRYQQFWRRFSHNYQGGVELWFLMGETLGWDTWNSLTMSTIESGQITLKDPHVNLYSHDTFAKAVAPIVVEDRVLGELTSGLVIVKDNFDIAWHRTFSEGHSIPWPEYQAAIDRSTHKTMEQMEGAAALLGVIANTITNLGYRNARLERELSGTQFGIQRRTLQRKELVRQAIAFMQANLENPITVNEVACELALSPSYFCNLFTEQIGRNPSEFLIELRLERAKDYLAHSSMHVIDVCMLLGLNPSYFSRLFKRRVGYSPGQYARRMREAPSINEKARRIG